MEFNKKIFALLLERAKGERSWRKFAQDCDVSYVQMRKLYQCEQDNPPRKKLLEKLGKHSENGITTEDYMCAANAGGDRVKDNGVPAALASTYAALKPRQKRQVEDFAAFLLSKKDED